MSHCIDVLDASDDDDWGWNLEGSGLCSVRLFASSVSVWVVAQGRAVTVDEAALSFNVRPEIIIQAIEWDIWMFIGAGNVIEHDGE